MASSDKAGYMREYRRRNLSKAERDNEASKAYQKTPNGRASLKAASCNTSSRRRGAKGTLTKEDILNLWSDGIFCKKCGSNERVEIDHIRPIFLGGQNCYENLQLLCNTCHFAKSKMEKMIKTQPHNIPESFWDEIKTPTEVVRAIQTKLF